MTIAWACHPPAQVFCRRLAGRWWIAQHPPSPRPFMRGVSCEGAGPRPWWSAGRNALPRTPGLASLRVAESRPILGSLSTAPGSCSVRLT